MRLCPTCGACFRLRTTYREHMKTCHGWQRVICPPCPGVKNLQISSSLKKHIGKIHPIGVSHVAFTIQDMCFFSQHPRRYRAISTVPPELDASIMEVQKLMREWANITVTPEAAKLLQDVEKDWTVIAPSTKRKAEESVGETLATTKPAMDNPYNFTFLDVTLSKKAHVRLRSGRPCLPTRDFSWLRTTYTQHLTAVPLGHSTEYRNWKFLR